MAQTTRPAKNTVAKSAASRAKSAVPAKTRKAKSDRPAAEAASSQIPAPPPPGIDAEMPSRDAIEQLSMNLAKAAMTAQQVIAEAALKQADRPAALSPDPFNVAPAMTQVMTSLASRPDKLFQAQAALFSGYMDLWTDAARQATGQPSELVPAPRDKRFAAPEWSENPVFDVMRRSYLLSSTWLNDLISSAEDVDPRTKRRAEFFTKLLTDAFSPSNFLASNPTALKQLMETNGESLVKGMQNFAADMERGDGSLKISQADYGQFKVGENVATAPGQVVWRDELFDLIQFDAATDKQRAIPLLIFPPWINKFYILDLQPENSVIRYTVESGHRVFVVSWRNPDAEMAQKTWDDYVEDGVIEAVIADAA